MAFNISNIGLSYFSRNDETSGAISRPAVLEKNELKDSYYFLEGLHNSFNQKSSKGYASFSKDRTVFSASLTKFNEENISFEAFNSEILSNFLEEAEKYNLSKEGYLLVADYEHSGSKHLLVAHIGLAEHFSVNNDSQIKQSRHLDLSIVNLAARIDMSSLDTPTAKTITFLKGRNRILKAFTLDFLGADETIDTKLESLNLVHAIETFVKQQDLCDESKQQLRKSILSDINESISNQEDFDPQRIDGLLEDLSIKSKSFSQHIQDEGFPTPNATVIDKKIANKLVRMTGSSASVSISFDRKLLGEHVVYDPEKDTLTFSVIPTNLKSALLREFSES